MQHVALVVGAMKCGTTSLFEYLAGHPEICPSVPKEPNFFYGEKWPAGMEEYSAFWPDFDPHAHTIALEASTGYSKWPDIPDVTPRIRSFSDQHGTKFKFLYIVRDPLQMIGSGLGHGQDRGWGKGSREKLLRHLLNVADFNTQMSRYCECFALEDLHVLQLERLATDHVGQLDAIAQFLGLGSGFVTTSVKAAKHNSTESRQAKLSRKTVVARMSQVLPLKPLWSMVPAATRDSLRPLANWLASGRRAGDQPERWRLTDAEREDIACRLKPGVCDLAAAYGIDPTLWPDYSAALNGASSGGMTGAGHTRGSSVPHG